MAVYTTTSIQEVIARIIRNTGLQDTSYLQPMDEWIPEAMGLMKTKYQLDNRWKDVCIRDYKGRMPCGLVTLKAVQHGNCRLKYYNSPRTPDSMKPKSGGDVSVYPGVPLRGTTVFGTHLVRREAVDEGVDVHFYETDLYKIEDLNVSEDQWYFTELDWITVSIPNTWIRVHYRGIPVDENGLPLIPDEENYKTAIYWYVRGMMIGAGYEDRQFSHQYCMDYFDRYAAKARSRISYPSVDQQESKVENLTRLVFPDHYWDSFYNPGTATILY